VEVGKMAFLLHQLLSESAAKYQGKEAIVCKDEAVSYAELEDESNRLAHGLSGIGVEKGGRVGIYLNRSIASITALFGILKAGAAYVPIDPFCPPGRLHYILNKCGIKFLITSQEKLAGLERALPDHSPLEWTLVMSGLETDPGPRAPAKALDWQKVRGRMRKDPPLVNAVDTDLAYILFTSGSTGNPKGVMLSHLNALTFVNSAHDLFRITADDRFSNICPLHFDMSVFDLFVAFKAGATVVVIPETTTMFPLKLAEAIAGNKISVWNSVPSALSLLATYKDLAGHDLSSLRLICFAGELFPMKYLKRLLEVIPAARFCNMYGQTEANSSLYYWVEGIPGDGKAVLPIGRPMPNFEVFALDDGGELVTESEKEGELYVRASTVALGYWNEEGKTEKAFVRNPLRPELNERVYRTGDLVHLDSDGNYVFLGRKDHMIKSRGYRIEMGEIETVLCSHPEIKNAVVIPIPDELIGNRICTVIVPFSPGKLGKDDIVQYCARQLPKYMVPEIIEFRDSLPTTSSGKIDRQKLSATVKTPTTAERSTPCRS
jgi:amino acid adenylation domain-containing protein